MQIRIHGNINKKMMTIKEGSKGKAKHEINKLVVLSDAEFIVQPKGHERIVKNNTREVVAYVKGKYNYHETRYSDNFNGNKNFIRVSYNPKKYKNRNYFYNDISGERISKAKKVYAIATVATPTLTRLNTYIKREDK